MMRSLTLLVLCGSAAILASGCATKGFVQKQVTETETRLTRQMTAKETTLTERVEGQETKLRQTADRVGESREAIAVTDQRLTRLDSRVGEVGSVASGARASAEEATAATQETAARLSQRIAGRNRYRLWDTRSVYFASGQIEIRNEDFTQLDAVAKALAADPNAIVELQGYADAQGSDRYNLELARERVEVVMRYLVQRHGTELRQLRALSMGKETLAAGEKPSPDALSKARRVDIRFLTPWSSWEDAMAQTEDPSQSAPVDGPSASPATSSGQ